MIQTPSSEILEFYNKTIHTIEHKRDQYYAFANLLGIDLGYFRINQPSYDKSAILEIDKQYCNKFTPYVLEVDYDGYYPQCLLSLEGVIDDSLIQLTKAMLSVRQYFKSTGDSSNEKTAKIFQNAFVGCLAANYKPIDRYAHCKIMEVSRLMIRKLADVVKDSNNDIFYINTDGIYIACQTESEMQNLQNIYQKHQGKGVFKGFPFKVERHLNFYKFPEMQDFFSYTYKNGQKYAVIKGISKDQCAIEALQPFILDFCVNKNVVALLDAYNVLNEFPKVVKRIGNKFKHFKEILGLLDNKVRFRTEHIENGRTVYEFHWVPFDNVQNWVASALGYEDNISIHEVIVNDMNHLTFDIDYKTADIDIDRLTEKIHEFVDNHPIITILYNQPTNYVSASYQLENKTSIHMTFNILLPLKLQKQLALELQQKWFSGVDDKIYSIGKSLRIPFCPKIVNNQVQTEYRLFFEYSDTTISEILFTPSIKPTTLELTKYAQLYLQTNAIDYETTYEVDRLDQVIEDFKTDNPNLGIRQIEMKTATSGIVHVKESATCHICKRSHENKSNKSRLRLGVDLRTEQAYIDCFQNGNISNRIKLEQPLKVEITNTIRNQILSDSKIINQPYLLAQKTDIFQIPNNTIVYILSGMGSGKSQIIEGLRLKYRKILFISTRRAFTYAQSSRFAIDDNENYMYVSEITQSGICQVESLSKCGTTTFDIVIADEMQSFLQQMLSNSDNDIHYYNAQNFVKVLKRSNKIVVCDGQLEQSTVDWFKTCFPEKQHQIIENLYQKFQGVTVDIITKFKEQEALDDLKQIIEQRYLDNKKTWVLISQKRLHLPFAQSILDTMKDIKIKVFNGDRYSVDVDKLHDPSNQNLQTNVNKLFFQDADRFKDFDVIISNSSLTCGVDCSDQEFYSVVGMIQRDQYSPQQLLQALFRSRDVKDIKLYCSNLKNSKLGKIQRINMFADLNSESSVQLETCQQPIATLIHLAKQYVNDLNFLGRDYLIHHLRKMGCQVNILEANTSSSNGSSSIKTESIGDISSIHSECSSNQEDLLDDDLLTFKDCFAGLYIDEKLNEIWEQPRYVFNALQLANNEIMGYTQSHDCQAIELLQTQTKWSNRTQMLTEVFKAYIQDNKSDPIRIVKLDSRWQMSIDPYFWDWIYKFGVDKYFELIQTLKKSRTTEYFKQVDLIKKKAKGFKYIKGLDPRPTGRQLNQLYRSNLNATIKSQKTSHKVFTYIIEKNLHDMNKQQLEDFLRADIDNFGRMREDIANYLGYYCYFKEKKVNKKHQYIINLVVV